MGEEQDILIVDNLTKEFQKEGKPLRALSNVSFELKKGEVLGVIGRNGAGKSTLLKVLSQITSPSSGEFYYDGQLTSIIDIGTGFHADLSGRENVYLSALLLGYSKNKVKELYDEIVDFSGLEEFMEMPVKHYSSGMYLRLAFSIAFHSTISILLLDEVIAVGDTDFKRKCYSKIKELKARGMSIILVSHHLELIVEQCDRCILLEGGELLFDGNPLDSVNQYYELIENNEGAKIRSVLISKTKNEEFTVLSKMPLSTDHFQVNAIELVSEETQLTTSSELVLRFQCSKLLDDGSFEIGIYLVNMNGVRVLVDSYGFRNEYKVTAWDKGEYCVDVTIPSDLLSSGVYRIGVLLCVNRELVKEVESVAKFRISPEDDSSISQGMGSVVRPKLDWQIKQVTN